MAKKNNSGTSGQRDFVKFCAFWGLAIAAILFVVTGILDYCNLQINVVDWIIKIFRLLGELALLVAVAVPAWKYVRGAHHGKLIWIIQYIVFLVVYILGCVFGIL